MTKEFPDLSLILQESNLQLNPSNFHVPHWATQEMSALARLGNFVPERQCRSGTKFPDQAPTTNFVFIVGLDGGDTIPLARKGLLILLY